MDNSDTKHVCDLYNQYKNINFDYNKIEAIDLYIEWYNASKKLFARYFTKDNEYFMRFCNVDNNNNGYVLNGIFKNISSDFEVLIDKIQNDKLNNTMNSFSNKIFIIHGSDDGLKNNVARIVAECGLKAIILSEQPSSGMTIIEKFEKHSEAGFAIAILSSDDYGFRIGKEGEKMTRARQNVIFELGFFIGKLGRDRIFIVCADKNIETPSDINGMYFEYSNEKALKISICKELKNAGYNIDLNESL